MFFLPVSSKILEILLLFFVLYEQVKSKTAIDNFTYFENASDLVQERIVTVDQGFSHLIKDEQVGLMIGYLYQLKTGLSNIKTFVLFRCGMFLKIFLGNYWTKDRSHKHEDCRISFESQLQILTLYW